MNDHPLIDLTELLRLRHGSALSQRELGLLVGVSGNTIARIEAGRPTDLTLAQLASLANSLGTTPRNLLARSPHDEGPEASADADQAKVAAALAESTTFLRADELAYGLSWTLERTRTTLVRLRRLLHGTGLDIRRSPNGYALTADGDALAADERRRLEQARFSRRGLRAHEAALLRAIATGRIDSAWEAHARTNDRIALASLLKADYVQRTGNTYAVSQTVTRAWEADLVALQRLRSRSHERATTPRRRSRVAVPQPNRPIAQ